MANQPSREQQIFIAALPLATREERAAYLKDACAGDAALRQRVEARLQAYDQAGKSLDPDVTIKSSPSTDQPTVVPITEKPGDRIGRYKLLERIGEGGCGVVYVAEQTEPVRRRVAIKVIKLGMDTKQVIARFEAERQALAMMDHPNIAKVLDAGATETGPPFFVMELVRGVPITEYCDQNNLSTHERIDLFIKVCQAIQHAHQKGIIHRDIKPSNILVTLHDGVPVPKVIDFGIAKATEGRLTDATVYTQLHQFIGTPAYMSPEQAEMSGLDIDTRSDIYSLGVLLYELLTGRTPFDANELMSQGIDAMRKTIREKEPVRPSTRFATLEGEELTTTARRRSTDTSKLVHQLRGDLDWIVMKCLEKDRTRRYDTANGVAFDLKRHLNNEPVLARPPSAAYKFQKAFRRNKLIFAAGTAVAIALVAGLCLAALGFKGGGEAFGYPGGSQGRSRGEEVGEIEGVGNGRSVARDSGAGHAGQHTPLRVSEDQLRLIQRPLRGQGGRDLGWDRRHKPELVHGGAHAGDPEADIATGRCRIGDSVETDSVAGNLAGDSGGYFAAAEIDRDDGVASQVVGVQPVGDGDREGQDQVAAEHRPGCCAGTSKDDIAQPLGQTFGSHRNGRTGDLASCQGGRCLGKYSGNTELKQAGAQGSTFAKCD